MTILENAQGHFKRVLENGLIEIPVPEWNGSVYHRRAFTLAENAKLLQLQEAGKTAEALAEAMIKHARDVDGRPLFKQSDRLILMKSIDQDVLGRIVNAMLGEELDKLEPEEAADLLETAAKN